MTCMNNMKRHLWITQSFFDWISSCVNNSSQLDNQLGMSYTTGSVLIVPWFRAQSWASWADIYCWLTCWYNPYWGPTAIWRNLLLPRSHPWLPCAHWIPWQPFQCHSRPRTLGSPGFGCLTVAGGRRMNLGHGALCNIQDCCKSLLRTILLGCWFHRSAI